jgi:hypothetical protein
MDIVIFGNRFDERRIEMLWRMFRLVREVDDEPQLWKLDHAYAEAVCRFKNIQSHEALIQATFLDVSIDLTTCHPSIIGANGFYPFISY